MRLKSHILGAGLTALSLLLVFVLTFMPVFVIFHLSECDGKGSQILQKTYIRFWPINHVTIEGEPVFNEVVKNYLRCEKYLFELEILEHEGLSVSAKGLDGKAPIHFALLAKDKQLLDLLLEAGVSLDVRSRLEVEGEPLGLLNYIKYLQNSSINAEVAFYIYAKTEINKMASKRFEQ